MMNIKKNAFIFLLGTVLPTFCMEMTLNPAGLYPLINDGEQWIEAAVGEDLKKFEGMLFAFRYRSGLVPETIYSIHPPTCYGILTKTWSGEFSFEEDQDTMLDHLGTGRRVRRVYVTAGHNFSMRRLTLEEACALNGLHKEGNGNFREMLKCLYPSEIPAISGAVVPAPGALFKLKHLTPKQQLKYVKQHCKSGVILCGLRRKKESPASRLPKEILRLIAQQVIDLEVQNGETVLKLE